VLDRHVGLSEHYGIATPPGDVLAHFGEQGEVLRRVGISGFGHLDDERNSVHPEPGDPELEPETLDSFHLRPHLWVGVVEVRLEVVETV
jgi:hypothetical protein